MLISEAIGISPLFSKRFACLVFQPYVFSLVLTVNHLRLRAKFPPRTNLTIWT